MSTCATFRAPRIRALGVGTRIAELERMATKYGGWQEEPFYLVRRHRPEDPRILRDVRAALAGILGVEARNLVVIVDNGEVTLAGCVPERWMQLEIEHAALHVDGVRDVVSRVIAPKTTPK